MHAQCRAWLQAIKKRGTSRVKKLGCVPSQGSGSTGWKLILGAIARQMQGALIEVGAGSRKAPRTQAASRLASQSARTAAGRATQAASSAHRSEQLAAGGAGGGGGVPQAQAAIDVSCDDGV